MKEVSIEYFLLLLQYLLCVTVQIFFSVNFCTHVIIIR